MGCGAWWGTGWWWLVVWGAWDVWGGGDGVEVGGELGGVVGGGDVGWGGVGCGGAVDEYFVEEVVVVGGVPGGGPGGVDVGGPLVGGGFGDEVADAAAAPRTNERKYPDGLGPLIDHVRATGMEFRLWVEPEMVNPDSDLYRAHPNWVLGVVGYPQVLGRHQLVLDLGRREVCA